MVSTLNNASYHFLRSRSLEISSLESALIATLTADKCTVGWHLSLVVLIHPRFCQGSLWESSLCLPLHTGIANVRVGTCSSLSDSLGFAWLLFVLPLFINALEEHCLLQFKLDISYLVITIWEHCCSFPLRDPFISLHFTNTFFYIFPPPLYPTQTLHLSSSQPCSLLHLQPFQAVTFLNLYSTSKFARCFPSSSTPGQGLLVAGLWSCSFHI